MKCTSRVYWSLLTRSVEGRRNGGLASFSREKSVGRSGYWAGSRFVRPITTLCLARSSIIHTPSAPSFTRSTRCDPLPSYAPTAEVMDHNILYSTATVHYSWKLCIWHECGGQTARQTYESMCIVWRDIHFKQEAVLSTRDRGTPWVRWNFVKHCTTVQEIAQLLPFPRHYQLLS